MINAETERQGDAEKIENLLSEQVLDAAIEVHRTLGGPGLLESLYEDALFHELRLRGIPALSQVLIPVTYKNCKLRDPMRLDILYVANPCFYHCFCQNFEFLISLYFYKFV